MDESQTHCTEQKKLETRVHPLRCDAYAIQESTNPVCNVRKKISDCLGRSECVTQGTISGDIPYHLYNSIIEL